MGSGRVLGEVGPQERGEGVVLYTSNVGGKGLVSLAINNEN